MKDATALRQAMAPYPTQLLGAWSFVLVPADDWKALVLGQGGDPVSPAFSMLDQRATLLDASLFTGTAARNEELLKEFGLIGPALVDLAVTHEMGHGICQENNERKADDYGRELREGRTLDCGKKGPAEAFRWYGERVVRRRGRTTKISDSQTQRMCCNFRGCGLVT